ncbi:MAG TPA: thioesterase family protein [Polyangiaceae bacterium]|jgi:acyl-CoA thioester hydrolase|nr:thioesterase family protein [Polyangiaceae bacterium]
MIERLDPDRATSVYRLAVRFCETDLMGVVHHANYLVYCEAARVDWLHKRGVSYQSWLQHGIHLPVVETRLRFKKAARFDELLDVTTTATELTRVTVRFAYRIRCADQLVCEAETMLACVGDDLKLKRLPAAVAEVFRSPEIVSV